MNIENEFTLKQHFTFLMLSTLISSACLFFDMYFENLINHQPYDDDQRSSVESQKYYFTSYEVTHSVQTLTTI